MVLSYFTPVIPFGFGDMLSLPWMVIEDDMKFDISVNIVGLFLWLRSE